MSEWRQHRRNPVQPLTLNICTRQKHVSEGTSSHISPCFETLQGTAASLDINVDISVARLEFQQGSHITASHLEMPVAPK